MKSNIATIIQNDSLINALLNNKHVNDSLIDTLGYYVDNIDLNDKNKGIVSQISMLAKANADITILQDSLIIQKANVAIEINDGLTTSKIYEQNQISFFRIYLNWLSNHHYSFSAGEIDTLYDIAKQCPLDGGKAVYYARNLYRLIDATLTYDDESACGESEERRSQNRLNKDNVFIQPNPTSDFFDVIIHQDVKKEFSYVIFDQEGRICSQQNNIIGNSIRIHTSNLMGGIYNLQVKYGNGNISSKKVVIIR